MRLINLTGKRFGRLLVEARSSNDRFNKPTWLCLCSCGNRTIISGNSLRKGDSQSCGCIVSEICSARNTKHNHANRKRKTRTYNTWVNMKNRCTRPDNISWAYYGGREIRLCERWHVFENFLADMGERPEGKTLDRIDNNKDYTPENCRWATPKEQAANSRPKRKRAA